MEKEILNNLSYKQVKIDHLRFYVYMPIYSFSILLY